MPSKGCPHLELVEVLYLADEVVLQVQYPQLGAQLTQQLDGLNVLLVQGHLLQV
jgi:hypothetical protein